MQYSNSTSQQTSLSLLNLLQIPQSQLQKLYDNENQVVWKCLLKIQQSNRMKNQSQAVQELKLAKSQIYSYMRTSKNKSTQLIYRKIIILIYCNLVNRLFCLSRYKQAMQFFDELKYYLQTKLQITQCIYNMFGFSSLYLVSSYRLQNNHEYKYSSETQVPFLYILGKVKKVSRKLPDAKAAFQKILTIHKSISVGTYLLMRVYCYLAELDPNHYKEQYSKLKKQHGSQMQFTVQQKKYSQQIIQGLLDCEVTHMQKLSSQSRLSIKQKETITKSMFVNYLTKKIGQLSKSNLQASTSQTGLNLVSSQKKLSQKYTNTLTELIKKQSNGIILAEILNPQVCPLAQEALNYYFSRLQIFSKIVSKLCSQGFKKLYQSKSNSSSSIHHSYDYNNCDIKVTINKNLRTQPLTDKQRQIQQYKKVLQKFYLDQQPQKKLSAQEYKNLVKKYTEMPIQRIKQKNRDKIIKINRKPLQDVNRANQILKMCIAGSFLMKFNVGNGSVVKRFVRIEEKGLKWAQNQKQADSSGSLCKWKNVISFFYGKETQNLKRSRFAHFQPWRCFSLVTQQRSYDFYCDNQPDIFLWLQGLTYQLQKFHENTGVFPVYDKGLAKWQIMYLKMSLYIDPNKKYKSKKVACLIGWNRALMSGKIAKK